MRNDYPLFLFETSVKADAYLSGPESGRVPSNVAPMLAGPITQVMSAGAQMIA
jgi:hypothetical protein